MLLSLNMTEAIYSHLDEYECIYNNLECIVNNHYSFQIESGTIFHQLRSQFSNKIYVARQYTNQYKW